ncbi:vgr related protein [Altererythrobacter sp.]|nr:vgr related protein [Altererythrobacter sp.]
MAGPFLPHENDDLRACPAGGERHLSEGEIALAKSVFGNAIDYAKVSIKRKKWFPFQPRHVTMAPRGHIHFHPGGTAYCDDFSFADFKARGLFIHEMTHVWQTQQKGEWYLPLHRHPFCRYDYSLKPAWGLEKYGIEQQAEIVKHAYWLRTGVKVAGIADPAAYDLLVKFPGATA